MSKECGIIFVKKNTYALLSRISLESLGTLTPEGGPVIVAPCVEAAGVVLTLVEAPAIGVGVAPGPRGALAYVASVLVDTFGPGSARVTQTLVEVRTLKHWWSENQKYEEGRANLILCNIS